MILLEILYALVVILLAVYGFNTLLLTWLSARNRRKLPGSLHMQPGQWPYVTVQLPVYNERFVAKRLIDAVARLDYPLDRLEIQVLDDSDDNTRQIIAEAVAGFQSHGLDITHIRRENRSGFKSGALEYGMRRARGEFIVIFDADFIPAPDYLKSCLPHLLGDAAIGCVQARWGHINRDTSWLTRAQGTGIDGHFQIEQAARSSQRYFLNFNGTAGIWRRTCIEDAGGWQHDTLTEDLDLSYRAQVKGWRILYLPHVTVPAELPVHINAFKRQQFRWAKGSIQTARKLLPELWRSRQPFHIKLEGTIHLTHYFVHLLILLNLLLTLPVLYVNSRFFWAVHIFTTAAVGPLLMYWISMRRGGQSARSSFKYLVVLLFMGMGLSVNNTRAVIEAGLGVKTSFLRTPKFNITGAQKNQEGRDYLLPRDANTWLEFFFALYAVFLLGYVVSTGAFGLALWLVLYTGGFTYILYLSMTQTSQASSNPGGFSLRNPLKRMSSPGIKSQPLGD